MDPDEDVRDPMVRVKFTEYGRLIDVGARFGPVVAQRVAELPPPAQRDAAHAFEVFVEYAARLHFRLLELVEAEGEVAWHEDPPPQYTLEEAQMRYVDKVEAFHQQAYALLSALCMLVLRIHVSDAIFASFRQASENP